MSAVPSASTSTSHSNFASIFNAALESYKRRTKQDLAKHPVLPRLQSCDSPEAILTALREQIPTFGQSQDNDDELTKWVTPTVKVLYSFSANLGGVGLVNIRILPVRLSNLIAAFQAFPPANIIVTGIGVLLLVCVFCGSLARLILTHTPRRLKMPALAKTRSLISLNVSKDFSNGLRFTLGSHRRQL